MTATILSFPSPIERDEIEFDRKGTSNYTRALDEGAALWDAVKVAQYDGSLPARIASFAGAVRHLGTYRPDDLCDRVILNDGGRIEMRLLPGVLLSLAAKR